MEKIYLRTFWVAMLCTASFAILGIWFEDTLPEAVFKVMGTFFIIGFANFLLWLPLVVYRFLHSR